jgi:hypothetical protein
MTEQNAQMKLRLPPGLKAAIERHAHENRRTMNAEIVYRLEAYERELRVAAAYNPAPSRDWLNVASTVIGDELAANAGHTSRAEALRAAIELFIETHRVAS